MSETAAYLRDELLPEVPYRQWVLTVPWTLRARLSVDRRLLSDVLSSFLRPIFAWQRRTGRSRTFTASLHAGRSVDASDREGLERLCRYGLRAPFSQERFSLAADGRVIYRLQRPWPDSAGVTQLVLEGTELLARLAARSRLPAPAERWAAGERLGAAIPSSSGDAVSSVPSSAPAPGGAASGGVTSDPPPSPAPCRRRWMPWATLLARVFYLDALLCVKCGGKRKVLAFLTDPQVVRRILGHLGLETHPLPLAPARVGERGSLARGTRWVAATVGTAGRKGPNDRFRGGVRGFRGARSGILGAPEGRKRSSKLGATCWYHSG